MKPEKIPGTYWILVRGKDVHPYLFDTRKEARNWRNEGDRVAKVVGLTVKFLR